jgi:hypothetical protein
MARRRRFGECLVACLAAAVLGCGAHGDGADPCGVPDTPDAALPDAAGEASIDARDVPADAAPEIPSDTPSDALPEVLLDAPAEASLDVSPDLPVDAPAEASLDASPDLPPDVPAPTGPVRFAVVSDTHLLPDPADERDLRWITAMDLFRALAPPAEVVFDTGDNVEVLLTTEEDTQAYLDGGPPIEVLETYRTLIRDHASPMDYQVVLGNHDDRYLGWFTEKARPLAAWLKAFQGTPHLPAAYYSVERRGCLFVVLDSTDLATSHESNDTPTFGRPQLDWLDGELARGLPTVVFWHHWIDRPADGTADAGLNPLLPVLRAHRDNVKAAFTGHGHEWRRAEWEGIRFFETPSLFEHAAPVYHLAECDGATGTVTVLDETDHPYP